MTPPNIALAPELRSRHYVLHSAKHPRRWVAFSPRKISEYRRRFGDDFCLVVTGDPDEPLDFYALPWSTIRNVFTDENRFPAAQKNGTTAYRWQMHLEGPDHHFQLELSRADPRDRPRFDATHCYGNAVLLGVEIPGDADSATAGNAHDDQADPLSALGAVEGRQLVLVHRTRERDAELVRVAKDRRLATVGHLACDVCSFDFEATYGELGRGFIEAHHTVPLRDALSETFTRVQDLALVCANCHRMLHRGRVWLSVAQLRAALTRDAG